MTATSFLRSRAWRHLRLTAPLGLLPLTSAFPSAAYSNAPTFLSHSGLASSVDAADPSIALHKAVLSGAISYVGPGSDNANATEHPERAFDGDDATSTGKAGNITVDLGADYVVTRVVVKFASTPTQYEIAWSPYLGAGTLPPQFDLVTGLGAVPASESTHQDYRDLAWINDAQAIDDRKLPHQPARFLNFHFHPVYSGTWQNGSINEIEIFGHPYVPQPGDQAFVSRKGWQATGYADAAPNGEGPTVMFGLDGQFTNPWRPQTSTAPGQWYVVDLGKETTFDQLFVVFAIGSEEGAPGALNVLATNDTANWGEPVAKLDFGESAHATFAPQKKRYLKLEQTTKSDGWWQVDELNLLSAVDPASVVGAGGTGGVGGASVGGTGGAGGVGETSGAGSSAGTDNAGGGGSTPVSFAGSASGGGVTATMAAARPATDGSCGVGTGQSPSRAIVPFLLALLGLRRRRR